MLKQVLDHHASALIDAGFMTILILIAAIPLLLVGSNLWDHTPLYVPILGIAWIAIALGWLWYNQQQAKLPDPSQKRSKPNFYRIVIMVFSLLLFAILTFYLPMQKAFWNSTDEGEMLYMTNTTPLPVLMAQSDHFEARPFESVGIELAQQFSSNSIDGFLWLGFMLRCASALLVYGIVQALVSTKPIALLAGLLFMVNPSEPWRYLMIVMMDYYLALFLLLLGFWLYLVSYRNEKRWMLLCACIALAGSLLTRESGLLLAGAWPFVLFLIKPRRNNIWVWLYAWIGTYLMMVARFAVFWRNTPDSYQQSLMIHLSSWTQIASNVLAQLKLSLSYFQGITALKTYWQYGLIVLLVVILLLWLNRDTKAPRHFRRWLIGLALAAGGVLLAIIPYFAFTEPNRTQFFAAPAQAIGWALCIGLLSSVGPLWFRRVALIVISGFFVISAVVGSLAYQDTQARFSASFNNIAYIFEQVHALAPVIKPHSLVLFVIRDGSTYFGGRNYQLIVLSRLALGVDAYQANFVDVFGQQPVFTPDGISLALDPTEPPDRIQFYPYRQIIAFEIAPDLTVTLLKTLPQALLPVGVRAQDYQPYTRIEQGKPLPLRFLRLPR